MLKQCSCCKKTLDEKEFNWKIKNVKRSYHCKVCSRSYLKSHYRRNHEYYLDKARKRDISFREIAHKYIAEYFQSHPCIDCGETDILVLEFDHKDRNSKEGDVASMIRWGVSFDRLKFEISKCEVRCANCHRRKTEIENDSWKYKLSTRSSIG